MRYLRFILILMLFYPAISFGKTKGIDSNISAIESSNRKWSDISANFSQDTYVELLQKKLKKSGVLKVKKKGKLYISYSGKGEKTYVSDGSTLWVFVPGDKDSLQSYPADDNNMPKEALAFLGEFGSLKKIFKISESNAFENPPDGCTALTLSPRTKNAHYVSLEALFGADGLLKELVINNTSGNKSHYLFDDIKTNSNISDETFAPR